MAPLKFLKNSCNFYRQAAKAMPDKCLPAQMIKAEAWVWMVRLSSFSQLPLMVVQRKNYIAEFYYIIFSFLRRR